MTLNELTEMVFADPLSLIGDDKFYKLSIDEDTIYLQGKYTKEVVGIIPQRLLNSASINSYPYLKMVGKTTTPRVDVPSECYKIEITLF